MVRNKASILVVSIWMMVIFSIFATGLSRICVSQINVAKRINASSLSFSAIFGVCNLIRWEIAEDTSSYDTLYKFSGKITKEFDAANIVYTLINEESKININTVPQAIIKDLPGISDDIAVDITTSALRPFNAKEELLLLESIDEEVLSQISPFITVKSNGQININTASEEVFESLGFDSGLINTIVSFRSGPDGVEATADDQAFKSKEAIIESLREFRSLSDAQQQQLALALGWLSVRGENFLLSAKVEVLGKEAYRYDIIINKEKILRWKEE